MILRVGSLAGPLLALVFISGCSTPTVNQGVVSDASVGAQPPALKTEPAKALPTWGKRYTWPDGLAVEVAAPKQCKPGEYAISTPKDILRAVQLTLTLINGTSKPFDTSVVSFGSDAQFNGQRAEQVYDSGGGCGGGPDPTTILPGKSFTMTVAFAVGAQPGELQVVLQPNFGADKAIFVGQA